jgi:hypothetical protein
MWGTVGENLDPNGKIHSGHGHGHFSCEGFFPVFPIIYVDEP